MYIYVCNTCSEMYCWYFLVWTERKMSMIFVLPSAVGFFYVWLREHASSRNCHRSGRIHRRFHICKVPSHFRKRSPRLKCYFIIENFSADLATTTLTRWSFGSGLPLANSTTRDGFGFCSLLPGPPPYLTRVSRPSGGQSGQGNSA